MSILLWIAPCVLNHLRWITRLSGTRHISCVLDAQTCSWHESQYHRLLSLSVSFLDINSRQPVRVISVSCGLLSMTDFAWRWRLTDSITCRSNLTLTPWHCGQVNAHFSCPWNTSTMGESFSVLCSCHANSAFSASSVAPQQSVHGAVPLGRTAFPEETGPLTRLRPLTRGQTLEGALLAGQVHVLVNRVEQYGQ
jgi:hypothetical protein